MASVFIVAAALLCSPSHGLASSRIIGDHSGESVSGLGARVGDGPGRPLYAFDLVEAPAIDESGKTCVAITMIKDKGSLKLVRVTPHVRRPGGSIAWGCFFNTLATTGWNNLAITTTDDTDVPLAVRAYSAGVIEGMLTFEQMTDFNKTVFNLLKKDTDGVVGAADAVERVVRTSLIAWEELSGGDVASEPKDDIPQQSWAAMLQVRGVRDGYNIMAWENSAPTFSMFQLMMMNMHAEIPAITQLYGRSEQAKLFEVGQPKASLLQTGARSRNLRSRRMSAMSSNGDVEAYGEDDAQTGRQKEAPKDNWPRWASHMANGAALVKRTGPMGTPKDLLTGHIASGNYGEMHRVMKTYKVNFGTSVGKIVMSSYPGCVSSTDDYFITEPGFVIMSTNLWVPTSGKYSMPAKTNEGVAVFVRAIIATRLAAQPRQWGKIYGDISGIAGAKQWIVTNYANFCAKKEAQGCPAVSKGTVFLFESLPTIERFGDVSEEVHEHGFFEAHGVPHFRQIREIFGLKPIGPDAFNAKLKSALIEKASSAENPAAARGILQQVHVGPSINGNVQQPITTRDDEKKNAEKLDQPPIPEGGIDAKLTTSCLVKSMQAQVISRPAVDAENPPFVWDTSGLNSWPHNGVPNKWDFAWQNFAESGLTSPVDDGLTIC